MGVWLLNFTPVPRHQNQVFHFFKYSEWSKNHRVFSLYIHDYIMHALGPYCTTRSYVDKSSQFLQEIRWGFMMIWPASVLFMHGPNIEIESILMFGLSTLPQKTGALRLDDDAITTEGSNEAVIVEIYDVIMHVQ